MNSKHLINISKFFSELSMYRRAIRSGPKLAGLNFEEQLSAHVVRAAQIAYILAYLEKADPEKSACLVLFHDNGELRVGDQNKVSARYFNIDKAEKKAFNEQNECLPESIKITLRSYYDQFDNRTSKEGIIAREADWLEAAIFAKEMTEIGYKGMQNWIENVKKALHTQSAKEILAYIEKYPDFTNSWWQGLKKMAIKKIKK